MNNHYPAYLLSIYKYKYVTDMDIQIFRIKTGIYSDTITEDGQVRIPVFSYDDVRALLSRQE